MENSLIIEIDEATKGIMDDLQSSLTSNIEGGVSAGLRRMSEDSQHQLTSLQTSLSSHLLSLEEELRNSKQPVSRLTRDMEDVLLVLTKFQSSTSEKLNKVEQVQEHQIQAMNEKVEAIFHEVIEEQQASAEKSLKLFKHETEKANNILTNEVTNIKKSFEAMTNDVTEKIQLQFEALHKEQEKIAERAAELQVVQSSFEQLLQAQKVQFSSMKEELLAASNQALQAQQKSFEEQLEAFTLTREQLVKLTNDARKEQLYSIQNEQRQITEQVATAVSQANEKLAQDVKNPAPFDKLQQVITRAENTLLEDLNQQPILHKLDYLQKQLEYAHLPFYKKWFKRKDAE